jgi:hypothetical protein
MSDSSSSSSSSSDSSADSSASSSASSTDAVSTLSADVVAVASTFPQTIELQNLIPSLKDGVIDTIKTFLTNNLKNPIDILVKSMEYVETIPNISGDDKKHVAMVILQNVMTNIGLGSQYDSIKDIISDTIEVIVSATKGQLDINKIASCFSSCLGLCKKSS